jgi:hypothetical protein
MHTVSCVVHDCKGFWRIMLPESMRIHGYCFEDAECLERKGSTFSSVHACLHKNMRVNVRTPRFWRTIRRMSFHGDMYAKLPRKCMHKWTSTYAHERHAEPTTALDRRTRIENQAEYIRSQNSKMAELEQKLIQVNTHVCVHTHSKFSIKLNEPFSSE